MRSQRNAPLIIFDGFVYRCERKIRKKTYWLCICYKSHKCTARLIINGNDLLKKTSHKHTNDTRPLSTNLIESKNLEDDDVDDWIKGKDLKQ